MPVVWEYRNAQLGRVRWYETTGIRLRQTSSRTRGRKVLQLVALFSSQFEFLRQKRWPKAKRGQQLSGGTRRTCQNFLPPCRGKQFSSKAEERISRAEEKIGRAEEKLGWGKQFSGLFFLSPGKAGENFFHLLPKNTRPGRKEGRAARLHGLDGWHEGQK